MRIAFHYPSRCVGRPIDPENLWTSPRGLTGSELACFRYAIEMGRRGHDVMILTNCPAGPGQNHHGVLWNNDEKPGIESWAKLPDRFDAICSWMAPDALEHAPETGFRLLNEQCSDHGNYRPGWEKNVDLFACLSRSHAHHMRPQNGVSGDRYRVMPNGVDLDEFVPSKKVSGKCVWASSHDRGLHHLLSLWPDVKRRVPKAELHVFYDPSGMRAFAERDESPELPPWFNDLIRRSRYCLEALPRLERYGVVLRGSVSRETMRRELASAEALAYPCDPVRYTETFGVTVLEAMASGCVPVLCLSDAFEELWGDAAPGVHPPFGDAAGTAYVDLLCGVLERHAARSTVAAKCRSRARAFSWDLLGERLERCLLTRGREGFDTMAW